MAAAAVAAAACFAAAAVGLALYAVQLAAVVAHGRVRWLAPPRRPGISILKPLCGVDDDLAANLDVFAALDYPIYEVLLGVRDPSDPAYPVAVAAARRHPRRLRVVVQRGAPGLNPKVNQLLTLARAARFGLFVVSDSNVRVAPGYLAEIAAALADPRVGLVTHAVAGVGERRLGALMDNLHLCASVGAGMIGAKRVANQDVVVGKSMALRRRDLDALGGFGVVADVLAEDYLLGRMVPARLGKKVVVAPTPVHNVSERRSARDFYRRYRRWSVIHRQAIGGRIYAAQLLLHPSFVAAVGLALHPSPRALAAFALVVALKLAYDAAALHLLRGGRVPLATVVASPLKDALLAAAWLSGLVRRDIDWRGNRLRVLAGTRLAAPATKFANRSPARRAA